MSTIGREYAKKARGRAGWNRFPGPNGGTCGAVWRHESGWYVEHCGHPTALRPYYIVDPKGRSRLNPATGQAFPWLAMAQEEAEKLARAEKS